MNITVILLTVIILLVFANLMILLKQNKSIDPTENLVEITRSISKFDETLKDEFQRNRKESGEVAKASREELAANLNAFSETNKENIKN